MKPLLNPHQINHVNEHIIKNMVKLALNEDLNCNFTDITSECIESKIIKTVIINRENFILCGKQWVDETFYQIDKNIKIIWNFQDQDKISKNSILCTIMGNSRNILKAERTALNFLQTLSAVSTKTNTFVDLISDTKCKILDTRKTIPGFRIAQKYAVYCGGGFNHRLGLFDYYLIKENHISIQNNNIISIINKIEKLSNKSLIEIEVENMKQFQKILNLNVNIIMLDNFIIQDIKKAVKLNNNRFILEASGNISTKNIQEIAKTGIDFISIGSLTKSIKAIDLSMILI